MDMFKKIIQLLSPPQKKQALVLSLLALIGMFFEMMGVGLIFPILSLMTEQDIANKYPLTQPFFDYFNNPTQVQLVISAMLVLTFFYFLKVLFLAYLSWKKVSFIADLRVYLSQKLFLGYLNQPYTFHLQRNSSQLVRNVTGDVKSINKGIISIMDLMIDGLVLLGVFSLLLWAEPIGAVSVTLFFGGTAIFLHKITRNRLVCWGEEGRFHLGKSLQHLYQGLGGIKELKLLGREKGFESQYFQHSLGMAKVEKKQKVFSTLPRLWFEFLVIVGLTGLVIVMLYQGKTPSELVPILGVFAAAAFRLMPSMVRITSALQNLRFNDTAVKNIHREFSILNKNNTIDGHDVKKGFDDVKESIELWQKIQIKKLSFSYPNVNQYVLDDINIDICRNESVGFVGGSGAGKSTLIDTILGLFPPSKGEIQIGGVEISRCLRGWQNQIGYVPQTIYLTDDTIRRNIAFGLADDEIDDNAVFAAIKSAQLEALIDDLAEGVNTLVGEHGVRLSGGQRQRIGIARALYRDPSVLVLDEATSALDINTEKEVMAAVNALHGKKTIITIAHRMTTVENCDRLYRLEEGIIVQEGTFDEVVNG